MTSRLEVVQLHKAAEIVANSLRRKIVTRELEADEPLPPEFQLMAEMGVAGSRFSTLGLVMTLFMQKALLIPPLQAGLVFVPLALTFVIASRR